jgi:hypothetical protein
MSASDEKGYSPKEEERVVREKKGRGVSFTRWKEERMDGVSE